MLGSLVEIMYWQQHGIYPDASSQETHGNVLRHGPFSLPRRNECNFNRLDLLRSSMRSDWAVKDDIAKNVIRTEDLQRDLLRIVTSCFSLIM